MAEAIRLIGINYFPLAGGTSGFSIFNPFIWLGDFRRFGFILTYLLIAIGLYVITSRLTNSPFGRLLRANRDSESTAASIGKNPVNVKLTAMIIGSMIATLAGVLFTFYISASVPPAYTRTDWSFWPWLMIMIGGRGNNKGAVVGTVSVVSIRRFAIIGKHSLAGFLLFDVTWLENIILGICLIVMIAFKPKGLLPEKPIGILDNQKRVEFAEKMAAKETEV
jgi:branched-chain amino acid transport system permease protein